MRKQILNDANKNLIENRRVDKLIELTAVMHLVVVVVVVLSSLVALAHHVLLAASLLFLTSIRGV